MSMDYGRDSGYGNVIQIVAGNSGGENWCGEQAAWETEDDYRYYSNADADTSSNSNYEQRQSQSRSGSEPPNKKSRNSQDVTSANRSKAIGKMFFKTKLCCKFRAGTCPYVTNCNFAHSIEELRRPPSNWQEIVAAHEEEKSAASVVAPEPREEFQIPTVVSPGFVGDSQRSYKGRHCKKFYTEEGCPYGDNCTFLHDEQSKNRESVAISLGPGGYGAAASEPTGKPSNWKTRVCNKWEMTGYCPFGSKCHFAHGAAELHKYGGGLVEGETRDYTAVNPDTKQGGVPSRTPSDNAVVSANLLSHSDVYHVGVPTQRAFIVLQRAGQRTQQKWKGPDKISRIYGDWIDDIE